jgi:hypothetical protein
MSTAENNFGKIQIAVIPFSCVIDIKIFQKININAKKKRWMVNINASTFSLSMHILSAFDVRMAHIGFF